MFWAHWLRILFSLTFLQEPAPLALRQSAAARAKWFSSNRTPPECGSSAKISSLLEFASARGDRNRRYARTGKLSQRDVLPPILSFSIRHTKRSMTTSAFWSFSTPPI